MGNGAWSSTTNTARLAAKRASGQSTFHHSDQIRAGNRVAAVDGSVDPRIKAGDASAFAGRVMREVCITDEHPNPTPIAVVLDVTGSNYRQAVAAHAKLPELYGVLLRKGYVEDPQILFGATGDAYCDRVPLQMGQFESDVRSAEQLEAIYLEGGGGGQRHETYELAAHFLDRHTHLEPHEKQGRKGYAFFIGDEMPYKQLANRMSGYATTTVEEIVGEASGLEEGQSRTVKEIFDSLQERYEVFFLFQEQGAYPQEEILPAWRELLGERALVLQKPEAVVETIALAIGLTEGTTTLEDGMADLGEVGSDLASIRAAGTALASYEGSGSQVARVDGELDLSGDTDLVVA